MEFPNNPGGPLDVRYSMTIVCWMYFDGKDGPLFHYGTSWNSGGVHFWVAEGDLFFRILRRADRSQTDFLKYPALTKSWKFVGASYNQTSGEVKLWVDGNVHTLNVGAGLELATQDRVRVGAIIGDQRYFKGRITQVQIYNRTLTQEEIQTIRNQVAGKDGSFAYDIRLLESVYWSERTTTFINFDVLCDLLVDGSRVHEIEITCTGDHYSCVWHLGSCEKIKGQGK